MKKKRFSVTKKYTEEWTVIKPSETKISENGLYIIEVQLGVIESLRKSCKTISWNLIRSEQPNDIERSRASKHLEKIDNGRLQ